MQRKSNERYFTDELISVVEILAQILLPRIGGRQLFKDNSTRDDVLVAGEIGRNVEHTRNAQTIKFSQITSVTTVTQVEKGQNLGSRMRIDIRRRIDDRVSN